MPSCYRMDSCMLLLTPLCERCPHRWSTNVPTGFLFFLHPVFHGLQYILLYALPCVGCGLSNLLAFLFFGLYYDSIKGRLIFCVCF